MPITTPFGNNTEQRSITGKDLTITSSTENTKLKINYSGTDSYVWNLPTSGGTQGQVLKIESLSNNIRNLTWGTGGGSGGGATNIGDLNNVTIDHGTLTDNHFLVYSNNTFENRLLQASDIPNSSITHDKLADDVITGLNTGTTATINMSSETNGSFKLAIES